jgi:AcrR family transcriptional regulator
MPGPLPSASVGQDVPMGEPLQNLRERKKARTRESLREAALELFARRGFDRTTVDDIAEACEVSPRTFFRYFATKEDVLYADDPTWRDVVLAEIAERPVHEAPFAALRAAMLVVAHDYERDRDKLAVRVRIVAESPQLQIYRAVRQQGWEADVVNALEQRSGVRGAQARHELELLAAIGIDALRVTLNAWLVDGRGPGLVTRLDRAFARLASGLESDTT